MDDVDFSQFTDEELKAISEDKFDKIPDEKLQLLAGGGGPAPEYPQFSGAKSAADIALSLGQGATAGYLPEIGAALQSRSVSGPGYEQKKQALQERLLQRDAVPAMLGEFTGSAASPLALGAAGALRGAPSLARIAAINAMAGGAHNAPIGSENPMQDRAINAGVGAGLGTIGGALSSALPGFAKRQAFKGLGPQKTQVKQAMANNMIEPMGETLLEEGVIGNLPRGKQALYERADEARESIGAKKGQLIDDLQALVDQFAAKKSGNMPTTKGDKLQYGVDVVGLRQAFKQRLAVDPDLPEAAELTGKIDGFIDSFAQNKEFISVKRADELKTKLGQKIKKWKPPGTVSSEPVKDVLNQELYRDLNQSVDDSAEAIASEFGPDLLPELRMLKKKYGALSQSQDVLENRIASDTANRFVSPSDYGTALGTGAGMLGRGTPLTTAGMAAAAAGAMNQLARKYGSQITAKQAYNLSKLLGSPSRQAIPIEGVVSGSGPLRNRRLRALEE